MDYWKRPYPSRPSNTERLNNGRDLGLPGRTITSQKKFVEIVDPSFRLTNTNPPKKSNTSSNTTLLR